MPSSDRRAQVRAAARRGVAIGVLLALLGAVVHGSGSASAQAVGPVADTFAEAPSGAASGVTGGAGGEVRVVTSLADHGEGTLRSLVASDGPAVVVFAQSGDVVLRDAIEVGSDLTLDGRGAEVTLVGKGLLISGQENVIVRNLKVHGDETSDSNDDAIGVQGGSRGVWIDHVEATGFEDGLIDIVQEATDVTVSWSHLHDHDKAMLVGANVRGGAPALVDVTVHHNHFEHTSERSPLVRHGRVHVVNNLMEGWGYDEDSGYAVRSDCGGIVLVEANVFRAGDNPRAGHERAAGCDRSRSPSLRASDNDLGGAELREAQAGAVDGVRTEGLDVEPADEALATAIRQGAGWQDVANPLPIETRSTAAGPAAASDVGVDDGSDGGDGFPVGIAVLVGAALVAGLGIGVGIGARRRPARR